MIHVICGAVKAGKSKKLIEIYNQLKDCGVAVFSSKFSLTNGEDIVSRYGTSLKAIPINSLWDIPHHISSSYVNYILIDEFQFLQMTTEELKSFFDKYYDKYNFFIFGLDKDYKNDNFSLMINAMGYADEVLKIKGYCDICTKEDSGRYSLRLENGKPADINNKNSKIILLDGEYEDVEVTYQTICNSCWNQIYRDN